MRSKKAHQDMLVNAKKQLHERRDGTNFPARFRRLRGKDGDLKEIHRLAFPKFPAKRRLFAIAYAVSQQPHLIQR